MSCTSASTSSPGGRAATLALALLVAACATAPRLEAPRVTVDAVRLDRLTVAEAQFTVLLRIANPNTRDIAVDAIEATVRIEDVAVGTARLAAPLRLPAQAEMTAALTAHADLGAALRAATAAARRAEVQRSETPTLRYAASGVATLEGGVAIPFARSGEFAWSRGRLP
jgi:LEA14-like dessication related protein